MVEMGAPTNGPPPSLLKPRVELRFLTGTGVTSPQPASCLSSWLATDPKARGQQISGPDSWSPPSTLTSVTSSCQEQQRDYIGFGDKGGPCLQIAFKMGVRRERGPPGALWASPESRHSHRGVMLNLSSAPGMEAESRLRAPKAIRTQAYRSSACAFPVPVFPPLWG